MADPLSDDLRERVCEAVGEGLSGREAAKRFKISPSSVSRWRRRLHDTGSVSPDAMGGDRRSERIEAHADILLARMGSDPDTTLEEYQAELAATTGKRFALSTIWRFFERHDITLKKRPHMLPSRIAPT
jgi:transposase